jgi:hypothetical protein
MSRHSPLNPPSDIFTRQLTDRLTRLRQALPGYLRFSHQTISHADLVAVFSMPHIRPQSASLRRCLAGGTSVSA